ncbi:esterase-like activity of phytase family protein [Rhizobium sp. CFBP 8762]|uniref:esterase-like activity of phytase family protein n=1 Tax=Rhizobium sp. CFBP 8762 TaxID=2775279 RepID=UPI00177F466B|nr:esterase-like activity of phytase family protein [Rhizobium sp. CFBP 8762]
MSTKPFRAAFAFALLASAASPALAQSSFNRIASLAIAQNNAQAKATSAEIVAASDDGMTLVYSDSPAGGIGFVDITDAKAPKATGFLPMKGEPTSVTIIGSRVFVGVNTSETKAQPSGRLAVVDLASKTEIASCDLGGQPDSVARNRNGSLLAIAIENERDEEVNKGAMPQLPAGFLTLVDVSDTGIDCNSLKKVDLTGIAGIATEDPEPEFVSFNSRDEVAVTLQENNHVVIVDGKTAKIVGDFSAGTVSLKNIDTKKDGALRFTGSMDDVPREPDSIKWLGDDRLVTANEGDLNGGSRSFTIFNRDGSVAYEDAGAMEAMAARLGHYPDKRNKKGIEPEGLDVARFGEDTLIFIAQERSSLIAVYQVTGAEPRYVQSLPSGISPEGVAAIAQRNLLVTANEADLRKDGAAGSHIMIYERTEAPAAYPQLIADLDSDGRPLGWAALSGAVADPKVDGKLYAVSDSVLSAEPAIYEIDATSKPARITGKTVVTRNGAPAQKLDIEGITLDGEGGFWLASEGRTDKLTPHALYQVDAKGKIITEVPFPAELLANETHYGAEGIAAVGTGDEQVLWIAMQRPWKDDPKDTVKLLSYTPKTGEWGAVHYKLDAAADDAWNGLSELTIHGDYAYVIERDNQIGDKAKHKKIFRIALSDLKPAKLGGALPVVAKGEVRDLMPDLKSLNGYVLDKVESLAIDPKGQAYVITDNDGVDESSGETMFWSIGTVQ